MTFAPQTDPNISFVQPQAPVQDNSSQALLQGLGNFLQVNARNRANQQAQEAASANQALRTDLVNNMVRFDAQPVVVDKPNSATINERLAIQRYVAAGGELDSELRTTIEATTGRPFDYVGQTEDQRQMRALTESQEFQDAYVAARATMGPDATEEDLTQAAMTSVSEQTIAAQTIARIQAGDSVNWELQGAASYDKIISTVHQTSIGGLLQISERGGQMTPNDISVLNSSGICSRQALWHGHETSARSSGSLSRIVLQRPTACSRPSRRWVLASKPWRT